MNMSRKCNAPDTWFTNPGIEASGKLRTEAAAVADGNRGKADGADAPNLTARETTPKSLDIIDDVRTGENWLDNDDFGGVSNGDGDDHGNDDCGDGPSCRRQRSANESQGAQGGGFGQRGSFQLGPQTQMQEFVVRASYPARRRATNANCCEGGLDYCVDQNLWRMARRSYGILSRQRLQTIVP